MSMRKALVVTAATVIGLAGASAAQADTVRLAGATTVVNVVVTPNRASVEKATGHTLEINGNATGKGLVELTDGKADAATVSEPMDIAIAAAEVAGKKIDPSGLKFHEVQKDEIVFIVHPSNTVSKLTLEQIRDIHTGKITNWKQVGGKDQAITVYGDALTGGTRAMIKKVVMGGQEYAENIKTQTAVARVAETVAKDESGVGGLGKGFADPAKVKLVQTSKIERPLAFVTVGEPSPKVKQVVDAFRAAKK
jgi:phosphate transport system substrate-binding protein